MTRGKYSKIPEHTIEGYKQPNAEQTIYDIQEGSINYLDINNTATKIKSNYIGPVLRALRGNHDAGAEFANLFEQRDITGDSTMENLEAFEQSLKAQKTTILLDYWLLRLDGRIHRLGGNNDAIYLTKLYNDLVNRLNEYELEMGKLNTHPSAHQNEERMRLIIAMKADWRKLLQPALDKYKNQWDTRNILLNIAACATVFGLIGLFCKNLYRLTQGKGLQLFQYEQAHSIKLDKLVKLYEEIDTATENDVTERSNYFTDNIEDTYLTQTKLVTITATLEALITQDKNRPEAEKTIPKKQLGALGAICHAFNGLIQQLEVDLTNRDNPNDKQELIQIHKDFMTKWISTVDSQDLYTKIENNLYPKKINEQLQQIIDFSEIFEKELHELNQKKSKPDDDRSISNFSIGSDN